MVLSCRSPRAHHDGLTGEAISRTSWDHEINDYDGTEDKSAGYVMATVNIGDQISILPGVRYQNLTTDVHRNAGA